MHLIEGGLEVEGDIFSEAVKGFLDVWLLEKPNVGHSSADGCFCAAVTFWLHRKRLCTYTERFLA